MTTLFDMTKRLAFYLMTGWQSSATGGSVTSVVDTLATFSADQVGGILFGITGDLANKTLVITSLTGTTQLNFATQTPSDFAAGNRYAVTNSDFNREALRAFINEAARKYGRRETEDETLDTVAGQEEYTLPAGVSEVKEVWMASATVAPFGWMRLYHWEEVNGELRFPSGFAPQEEGYALRLVYQGSYTEMDADADDLPEDINEDLLFWQAAVEAARDGMMRFHSDPKRDLVNKMNEAQSNLQQLKRNWHEWQRDPRPARY